MGGRSRARFEPEGVVPTAQNDSYPFAAEMRALSLGNGHFPSKGIQASIACVDNDTLAPIAIY